MEMYTDYYSQAAALAALGSNIDTNWRTVTLVSLALGWLCFQRYQLNTGDLSHKGMQLVRTASGIAQRTATNRARSGLNTLAKNLEMLLEGISTGSTTVQKVDTEIDSINAILRPVAIKIWTRCDAAYHSHNANVARQRLRHARTFAGSAFCWAIIMGTVTMFIIGPSLRNSASLESHDIHPYVVPAWVVKARPENRPRDGSSSHYQPACIDTRDVEEYQFRTTISTTFGSSETSHEHRRHPQSSTLTTIMARPENGGLDMLVDESDNVRSSSRLC
jgi:hypothetical protein